MLFTLDALLVADHLAVVFSHNNGQVAFSRVEVAIIALTFAVFAETFKYFYLLFAPKTALDFEAVTFNTEAHPLRLPAR